jgi:histidyl-tRNA synthetase
MPMISKPPGTEDIFPDRIAAWDLITGAAREVFRIHNYREINIPVLEFTEVFVRGLGGESDIVSKEMFTFEDRGGRRLTLRPEGTAGVVRAYVENGEYNRLAACKLFYVGPMFRAERPQKGRLRQFNQFGAEMFGGGEPFYDYEVISMMNMIAARVGIDDYTLLVNSIGCPSCRKDFLNALTGYYTGLKDLLCKDCVVRLERNPLRLLDCKEASCQPLKKDSPKITEYLDEECRSHYEAVKKYLSEGSVPFQEAPLLVRGLDYYTKTTFEFVATRLGGQNAFAAGGRYDNLVGEFGGRPTPAIGFAAGIERMEILITDKKITAPGPDAFVIHAGEAARDKAVSTCTLVRKNGFSAEMEPAPKGFKAQLKKADREKASLALIIGEDELAQGSVTVKDLQTGVQEMIREDSLIGYLKGKLRR